MRRNRSLFTPSGLLSALLVCALSAAAFAQDKPAAPAPKAAAAATVTDRVELQKKFDEALRLYHAGQLDKAAAALDEIIKMNPTSHEAMVLRQRVAAAVIEKWLADPKMTQAAAFLLERAAQETADVNRDPANIAAQIEKLGADDVPTRLAAVRQLVAIGPLAVPQLLDAALNPLTTISSDRKVTARIALRNMGPSATPPLLAALAHADDASSTYILELFSQTPDARALPALLAITEDAKRSTFIKEEAAKAIRTILPGTSAAPAEARTDGKEPARATDAAQAYYNLAQRYFYRDPGIVLLTPVRDRLLWSWKGQGKTFAENLVAAPVAPEAYARLKAESLLLDGLRQRHAGPALLELYVSNNYMKLEEASKDKAGELAATVNMINESLGAEPLYLSLGRALRDGNPALALRAIAALRAIGDPRPVAGNTLLAALNYPDKAVRVNAAETVLHLSPSGDMGGPEEVARVLAAGLGARLRERIVIFSRDEVVAKRFTTAIREASMVPETFKDPVEAIRRIKEMVPPVNLAILDARAEGTNIAALVSSIRGDARSSSVPVLVVTAADELEKIKGSGLKAAGFLPANADPNAIRTTISGAISAVETPAAAEMTENAGLIRQILTAVAAVPAVSKYPMRGLSEVAATLVQGQAADIRILALKAIAAHPAAGLRDRIFAIFAGTQEPVEVRRAAGDAFLALLPLEPAAGPEQRMLLRKMTAEADAAIAMQATHALSLAATPLAEREAFLSNVGQAALKVTESVEAPAPAPAKGATPTTVPAGKAAPAPKK